MKIDQVEQFFQSQARYLAARDVPQPVVVRIRSFDYEPVGSDASAPEKPVLRFVGWEKALVLNKINFEALKTLFPCTDTCEWEGEIVEIFCDQKVRFGNDVRSGIRIRPAPQEAEPIEEPPF